MIDDDALLTSGTVIAERFTITGVLGHGGMGTVYSAIQNSLDRTVALKVVHPRLAVDRSSRQRFLREARVSAALRHENAAEIYDFGDDGAHLFLAMELLEGVTLRSVVDTDLPPHHYREACRIAKQVANVLVVASDIGVVHRDLKPENIMLTRSRERLRVVVVDFGLAFRASHTKETGRITAEGMASGTPDYMAPEQIRGQEATPATDVYALGCILYELLTAHAPLVAGAPALTLSRHLFVAPEPIRVAFPGVAVPAELDDLVLEMMRKEPKERPSAVVVRDVLERLERGARERLAVGPEGALEGRAARMVSERPTEVGTLERVRAEDDGRHDEVVVLGGTLPTDVQLALAANGIDVAASPTDATRALVVLGADEDAVRAYARRGIPMIVEVDTDEADGVARMLRAGAAGVITKPVDGATLARRVARAIRNAAR